MDSTQGASGTFDFNAAMDSVFGSFGMPQADYNGLKASEEGNTSSNAFYLDEGIDTTSGAGPFGQQSFDPMFAATNDADYSMQLPLSLDNTSGSASWENMDSTINPFPSTPAQSFDTLFNPRYSNALGKRPLQLDVQDLPQSKRHETSAADFAFSPYATSASVTGSSSWAVDTQPTPSSSTEVGLSEEAADFCSTWFDKYKVLPSDRHINSLSQLTGESADAIRHWFGQALKQGMNSHDSAYKSQTSFTTQDPILFPVSQGPSEAVTQPLISDIPCVSDAQATITTASQSPLRGGKKGCHPTDDPALLGRDPNKIYQCTRKCGKRYGRKCDWKRNEEEGYPSKSWMCSLCISQGVERVKPCFRKYHFSQHFRNIHPGLNCADYEESSIVHSDTAFPRKCGFCPHRFQSRQDRIDHIAEHFKHGKCMLDWNDEDDDNNDDDNMDDDDDSGDRPDSGGFDNSTPFFPPGQDQQRGSGSKGDGGGSNNSDNQQPPQSGFFQFQLSQSVDDNPGGASSFQQHIKSVCGHNPSDGHVRGPNDSGRPCVPQQQQCSMHGGHTPAERDHQDALARNALAQSLIQDQSEESTTAQSPEDMQCVSSAVALPTKPGVDVLDLASRKEMLSWHLDAAAQCYLNSWVLDSDMADTAETAPRSKEKLAMHSDRVQKEAGASVDDTQTEPHVDAKQCLSMASSLLDLFSLDTSKSGSRNKRGQMIGYSRSYAKPPPPTPLPPPLLPSPDSCLDQEKLLHLVKNNIEGSRFMTAFSLALPPHMELSTFKSFASKIPIALKAGRYLLESSVMSAKVSNLDQQLQGLENTTGASLQDYWKDLVALLDSQSFLSVKLLGTGGFSTVDEVVHRETNLRISRKTLKNRDQSAIDELKKEVDVLQKLRHPHIVRFLGAYSKGDKMSILLSPVAETNLALWLDTNNANRPAGLAHTIVQMLGCLSSSIRYLHEQRPVVKHMDIKPQNILVMPGSQSFPHVILSDFGISSIEDTQEDKSKPLTRQYCAPEVPDGHSRGQAADIWSLGCVFAEMATVAFNEDNPDWLEFRQQFRGRDRKYYWQDVPAVQDWLSRFLGDATSLAEATVVRTVKSMLSQEPAQRPNAAMLTMVFTPAPCCLSWPNEKASFPGPLEELRTVETLVSEDGSLCCTQLHLHAGSEETQLCENFAHAKSWLTECQEDHDACHGPPSDTKVLPTRLLHIHRTGSGNLWARLVESSQLDPSSSTTDYVALSYVWGSEELTLSEDNMEALQREIPRDILPRAISKAISAADRIGYQYIWVDSLCVLQDSEKDKERECLAAANVYRNAALTIVLDQLRDTPQDHIKKEPNCSGGPKPEAYMIASALGSASDKLAARAILPAIDFLTPGFAWDTRAWSLQERLLSRRLLHLGAEQMYWECNTLKASETFPRGLPPLLWEKVHTVSPSGAAFPEHKHHRCRDESPQGACADKSRVLLEKITALRHRGCVKREDRLNIKLENLAEEAEPSIDNVKAKINDVERRSVDGSLSSTHLNSQTASATSSRSEWSCSECKADANNVPGVRNNVWSCCTCGQGPMKQRDGQVGGDVAIKQERDVDLHGTV